MEWSHSDHLFIINTHVAHVLRISTAFARQRIAFADLNKKKMYRNVFTRIYTYARALIMMMMSGGLC